RRRKELGLTLGEVARAVGTSDGYVWKLEQGLINLQNVPLPKIVGLLKVLRWTPEEFTLAPGVPLPGLSVTAEEAAPGVPLYKVPVCGE
ncbi:helix-turn-helix domain-containing protein, partial [Shewanella sp. C31]|nr:helix-turn-helix domain-containing protein [Shewanella electrica]